MNTLLRDLSLIWILVHCCFMFMFLYESRYSKKATAVATSIMMTVLVVVNLASVTVLGIEAAGQLLVVTCVLPSLIFFFIMSKNRNSKFIFTFCLIDTIVLEVMVTTKLLDDMCGIDNYVVMFAARLVLMPLLEYFLVKYLRKPYHTFQTVIPKGWGLFSLLAVLFYTTLMVCTYYPRIITERPEDYLSLILLMVIVPVMYVIIFYILWSQIKSAKTEEENRILSLQIKMAQERIALNRSAEEGLKIKEHDLRHYMLVLHDYLKNGEADKASDFISAINGDLDKYSLKSYCKNPSVNIVLSYYDKRAEKLGISLIDKVDLPESLAVRDEDIAVILSNALENAINALSDSEDKKLWVTSFLEGGQVYIEVKNGFSGEILFENGLPVSGKDGHGVGTHSIARLVQNYGGMYSFELEDNMFVFRCAV